MNKWFAEKKAWREKYKAHMKSEKWKLFRQGIIRERGAKCELCHDKKGGLHLHHLHYKTLGEETKEDVQLLCRACHALQHPEKKPFSKKSGSKKKKGLLDAKRRKENKFRKHK